MSAFDFPAWATVLFARPEPKLAGMTQEALTLVTPPKVRQKPGPKPGSKRKVKG